TSTSTEMWKVIERLKQGESINVQDLETNLFWEFEKFTSLDAIINSPQPIYDQEPSMVDDDDEMSKDKEIDKLMDLISLSFKKIYKHTNNNLQSSSNTSRANQDNSPRIHRNAGYESQRSGNVAGARETVDAVDSGPIFDKEPEQKVQNDDQYDVFAIECQHPEQSGSVHKTYLIEQDAHKVLIESDDEDADLAEERELLASLIAN
nr:hypothetical protein [Tanacetum cinerariifolium]